MPPGHSDPSRACMRASASSSPNASRPSYPIRMEERGPVTKNSRQVSGCSHDGGCGRASFFRRERRVIHLRPRSAEWIAISGDIGPGMTFAALRMSRNRLKTSRSGPDTIILRVPLLQRHHRRLANPATEASNAQEESEETHACDEPSGALIQLPTS